jgi:spermidine synthase
MKSKLTLLYLLTFSAGFSFLIYEVAWNRYLSLILGTTVTASTVVLSAFMAGFGLGAYFIGKKANRSTQPSKLLAILLAGIAILSLGDYFLFSRFSTLFSTSSENLVATDTALFVLSFVLLVLPAFLMGGLIPIVGKMATVDYKLSEKIGKVYAVETLGSAIGGLATGFLFLRVWGQFNTFLAASFILVLLALILLLFFKSKGSGDEVPKKTPQVIKANSEHSPRIALISTFLIGLTLLGLQILWIRIFRTYFTNTSYTFSLIAAFVILGYSIGSWLYKRRNATIKRNDVVMLKIILLMSVFLLVGLYLLANLPEFIMFPLKESGANALFRIFVIPALTSLLIVLPPAILSGYAFPLACTMYSGNEQNISKNIGRVMMWNTFGALVGPLLATFIFIPILGPGKSILLLSLFLILISIYIAKHIKNEKRLIFNKNVLIGISTVLFLFMLLLNPIQFFPPSVTQNDAKVLIYEETTKGTVTLINEKQKGLFGNSTFVNNSAVIGSNYDAVKAVKLVGHLPFLADLKCKDVLVVGFGIGVTTSAIASHPEVKHIDCVELVPSLFKSAHYYKEFNNAVYIDRRLNKISGDGRHFLQLTKKKYDLISCDPTHPVLGSGNLYTREYFEECHRHLNPGGMVSQYLPLHKLRLVDLLGIIKTFHSVFPNTTVWLGQYHAILLGKKGEGKIDFTKWKENVEKLPEDMFLYSEAYHMAANLVLSDADIEKFPDSVKLNTDELSYTEFFSLECLNSENLWENLKYLSENRSKISDVFSDMDDPGTMERFVKGNIKMTEGLYYSLKGDQTNSIKSLREACIINPEDQEYPFLIKFYFGTENNY